MKTTVVYHSADYDGIFCREIARKFLPDATLIGWDYGDPVPTPDVVSSDDNLYMLDISVEGLMGHPKLIWIDHHKSAIEKYGSTGLHDRIPGYRIDGVAACRLAWQWFTRNPEGNDRLPENQAYIDRTVSEPIAIRLAGEYDIWDKRDERTDVFQFGLRSKELTDFDWRQLLSTEKPTIEELQKWMDAGYTKELINPDGTCNPPILYQLLENGALLQTYQQRNDAGMMGRSFVVEFEGLKFLALTTARCNSLTFAARDVPETGHDALMGFYFNGTNWTISLYHAKHNTGIDLSQIAVKYGGGGHRGACGFQVEKLPFLA